jgi:flagellar protein FlbD
MITVTKLNDRDIILNCDLIELIESTPDTTITTTSGKKIIVLDTVDEIVEKVIKYKSRISRIAAE